MKGELEGKKAQEGNLPESIDENLEAKRHIRHTCLMGFPKGQNRVKESERRVKE